MEKTLLKMLKSQETTYDEYIAYLGKMTDEFQVYLSLTTQNLLFSKTLKIHAIPETTKPVSPVFTAGQVNKDDIIKLLGKVSFPNIEPEIRKLQPMEVVTHMKFIKKHWNKTKKNPTRNKHCLCLPLLPRSGNTGYLVFIEHAMCQWNNQADSGPVIGMVTLSRRINKGMCYRRYKPVVQRGATTQSHRMKA